MDLTSLIIIIIAGFFLGIFGAIIGSTMLILVPLLNFLGLPIHTALGTAKISVVSRELIPILEFHKKKLINFGITLPFLISGAVFAWIGTNIILSLNEEILSAIIGIFMIVISLIVFFKPDIGLKEKKIKLSRYNTIILGSILGALIGFYAGIFGGGANVFIIFSFVFLFGNTFLKAVANSKFPNLVFALISAVIFAIRGYVDWPFAIPLLISTAFGSYFGAKLAIKKGNKFIRVLFIGLVIVMAIKLLFFN